jgi:hypothetical protein
MRVIHHICCQMQPKSSRLFYVNSGPRQIQYSYISCYSGFHIQFNVSPLRLVVYRQIDACYTSHLLLNTGHNIQFMLCQLCSRSKSSISTFLHVQASIFIWKYLRCDWPFVDKMLRVIHHVCCKIQSTISGFRYVKSGPNQIWSQSSPILFQFFIRMLQHTIERISAAIAGLSTNRCALYSTFAAK